MSFTRLSRFLLAIILIFFSVLGIAKQSDDFEILKSLPQLSFKPEFKIAVVINKKSEEDVMALQGIKDQLYETNKKNKNFKIGLDIYQSKEDQEDADDLSLEIGNSGKYVSVVGHSGYRNSKTSADNYLVTKTPFISIQEKHFNLTQFNPWAHRLIYNEELLSDFITAFLKKLGDIENFYVVTDGSGLSPAFANFINQKIPNRVLLDGDVKSTFSKIKKTNTSAILLSGSNKFNTEIANQLIKYDTKILAIEDFIPQVQKILKTSEPVATFYVFSPFAFDLANQKARLQYQSFLKNNKKPPTWGYFYGRATIEVISNGLNNKINEILSIDKNKRVSFAREKILEKWSNAISISSSIKTSIGPIYFDPDGNAFTSIFTLTNEADYLTVSSEQVLINSDTGLLSPVDVIFVNTDIIEVLKVDDDLDRSKVNISIDFATKSKAEIFDEIKVGNVLIENKKKNFKFSQANGWSTLAGEVEIDAKRISGATDEKSGMDKLQIDIRHSFMDVDELVLVPSKLPNPSRMIRSGKDAKLLETSQKSHNFLVITGFSSKSQGFDKRQFSQLGFVFNISPEWRSATENSSKILILFSFMIGIILSGSSIFFGVLEKGRNYLGEKSATIGTLLLLTNLLLAKFMFFAGWIHFDTDFSTIVVDKTINAGIVFALGNILIENLNKYFRKIEIETKLPVPGIVKTSSNIGISLLIISAVVFVILEVNLTQVLATSGIIVFILGFALQTLILDFFAGLMINVEKPFKIGDWIEIRASRAATAAVIYGKVTNTNWRSATILTRDGNEVTIPNSVVSTQSITNFSSPSPITRITVKFTVETFDSKDLERLISELKQKPDDNIILKEKGSKIITDEVLSSGIQVEAQMWFNINNHSDDVAYTAVTNFVTESMKACNLNFAVPIYKYQNI